MKRALCLVALVACGGGEPPKPPPASIPAPPSYETAAPATTAAPTTAPPATTTAPPVTSAPPVEQKKYDLVVSFFSPGDGTDAAAFARFEKILAATKPAPVRKSVRWGKEGEHDECLDLTSLAEKDRVAFVARVRKDVGSSDRVKIDEKSVCREGR